MLVFHNLCRTARVFRSANKGVYKAMCFGLDPAKLQSKPKPYLRQRGYVIAGVCLSPYACVCLLST